MISTPPRLGARVAVRQREREREREKGRAATARNHLTTSRDGFCFLSGEKTAPGSRKYRKKRETETETERQREQRDETAQRRAARRRLLPRTTR